MIQRGVEHVKLPVTPGATHSVACVCGFKCDVVAPNQADASTKVQGQHRHPGAMFVASTLKKK